MLGCVFADVCSGTDSDDIDAYFCSSGTCPLARPGGDCIPAKGEHLYPSNVDLNFCILHLPSMTCLVSNKTSTICTYNMEHSYLYFQLCMRSLVVNVPLHNVSTALSKPFCILFNSDFPSIVLVRHDLATIVVLGA